MGAVSSLGEPRLLPLSLVTISLSESPRASHGRRRRATCVRSRGVKGRFFRGAYRKNKKK